MTITNTKPRRRRFRRIAAIVAVLILLGAVARLALIQGLIQPVRVVSGSMADALVGGHFEVKCGDCGMTFRCDRELPPPEMKAVCPNCGYGDNGIAAEHAHQGQRVLIDRLPLALHGAGRWDAVAFYPPGDETGLAVKRVVGLPGESLSVRGGDIFIDGRRLRKPIELQRQLALLVHDNDYRPRPESQLPPRWQSDASETRWQSTDGGFRYVAATDSPADAPLDWLTYRNWRCTLNPLPRSEEDRVRDNYGYNQGLSRSLNFVPDLMLSCRIEVQGEGKLLLLAHDGYETHEVEIAPVRRQLTLRRREKVVASEVWPQALVNRPIALELSLFDRQVLVAMDGKHALKYALPPPDGPLLPTSRPFGIAASGLTAEVARLRIYRDVYYLDPTNRQGDWELGRRLGGDEYFLLGDNVPLSRDSRTFPAPATRNSLIGKVLAF